VRSREVPDETARQLRLADEEFRAIYEQGLFAGRLDLEGKVIEGNRACIEGCGFTRADVIGEPLWECGWWNLSPEIQAWVHVDEHVIEVSDTNPLRCTPETRCSHTHGPGCGHEQVPHGDHVDYLVDGRLHHPHNSWSCER